MSGGLRDITTACTYCLRRTPWYKNHLGPSIKYVRTYRVKSLIHFHCVLHAKKEEGGGGGLDSIKSACLLNERPLICMRSLFILRVPG